MYFDSQGKALDLWDDSTGIPIAGAVIMILIDLVLYGLLAAWLDNILPTEYGTRRPPFFCLDPKYWKSSSKYVFYTVAKVRNYPKIHIVKVSVFTNFTF